MSQSVLVLVTSWRTVPVGYQWPPANRRLGSLVYDLFDPRGGWSVRDFWHAASYGYVDIVPDYKFIGSIPYDLGGTATAITVPCDRQTQIQAAIDIAVADGIDVDAHDAVVVWINPPSGGGALAGVHKAVLDYGYTWGFLGHTFLVHEVAHTLGFNHPVVLNSSGVLAQYGDPSCVMSAMACDEIVANGQVTPGGPPSTGYTPPADGGLTWWWDHVGPLPSAAMVWRYAPGFSNSSRVAKVAAWVGTTQNVTLASHSALPAIGQVVAEIQYGGSPYLVSMRTAEGWDLSVSPGLYLHRFSQTGPESWEPHPIEVIDRVDLVRGATLVYGELAISITDLDLSGTPPTATVAIGRATEFPKVEILRSPTYAVVRSAAGEATVESRLCGGGTYSYKLDYVDTTVGLTVAATGMVSPLQVEWTVDGHPVQLKTGWKLAIPTDIIVPGSPPNHGTSVTIDSSTPAPETLRLAFDHSDGNFEISVGVTVTDANGKVQSETIWFDIDGMVLTWDDAFTSDLLSCLRDQIRVRIPLIRPRIPEPGPDPGPLSLQLRRNKEELGSMLASLGPDELESVGTPFEILLSTSMDRLLATINRRGSSR